MPPKQTREAQPRNRHAAASQPVRRNTTLLREVAYDAIKHRIITGAFRPGTYLNELQLSDSLKIGRTPVHQALDRLMTEGLVDVIPHKGVIVKALSLNEILQIIEVQLINEPQGARLAAGHATDAELAALSGVVDRASQPATVRNIETLMLLDREFHRRVALATHNGALAELLLGLHEQALRFWFISLNAARWHEAVQNEHAQILDALLRRDPAAAQGAMRHHIESIRSNLIQLL